MTGRAPYHTIAMPFAVLLVTLTVTAAPAEAGLLDKVKSFTPPNLASAGLIKAIGDYTGGVLEEGTALVKEGLSGTVDAGTYNRRADAFFEEKVQMGVKTFLKDAGENIKLKVSNPLAGLKEKVGNTFLGKAAASVKEKLWATTAEPGGTGVTKPDEPYGDVDLRLALDVNEEETEWYQAETGILDETPLPREEIVAYVDESPDSGSYAYGEVDGRGEHIQRDCEHDWAGCPDDSSHRDHQANVQEHDPWSDIDDGADEWEGSATSDCKGLWVDIDCGNEYQGDENWSDETDLANKADDAQEGTYQEAADRLLVEETGSYSDDNLASDQGYEQALDDLEAAERERLAQLEAEAAEQERLARLEAETAERERRAQLEAEIAEQNQLAQFEAEIAGQNRQARREAEAAEQETYGILSGAIMKGLESAGVLERGTGDLIGGFAGLAQGSRGGFASGLNKSLNTLSAGTPNNGTGGRSSLSGGGAQSCPGESSMRAQLEQWGTKLNGPNGSQCTLARDARPVFRQAISFYQNCPAADPTGEMLQFSREMIAWANETERQACY